jgi:prevent-host-death family protein
MDVGVREFKQRLSYYLDLVAGGETVTVTDRGQPKAVVVSARRSGGIERGIDEGWIRPAQRTGLDPIRGWPSKRTTLDVLDDDRSQ